GCMYHAFDDGSAQCKDYSLKILAMNVPANAPSVKWSRFSLAPPDRPLWERLWALTKDSVLTIVTITFAIFLDRSLVIVATVAAMLVLAYRSSLFDPPGEISSVTEAAVGQLPNATHEVNHDEDEDARAIIFDGCARWSPGQLHGELRAGSWRWLNSPWPEEILLSAFKQHGTAVDNGEAMHRNIMNNYGGQLLEFDADSIL
ncbi:hypothetical protein FOL47_009629, partial [Perkinsus chesapeaki]